MPRAGHAKDRLLKLEALFWLVVVRLSLAMRSFEKTLAMHERLAGAASADSGLQSGLIARVEHAIDRAARLVPGTHCLPQAIAGRILLARHGIPCQLQIGVADNEGTSLEAHAWLERDGVAILGERRGESFTPLANSRDPRL